MSGLGAASPGGIAGVAGTAQAALVPLHSSCLWEWGGNGVSLVLPHGELGLSHHHHTPGMLRSWREGIAQI